MSGDRVVVFVHGWSVTHTNTYGGLPQRLAAEAASAGLTIQVRNVHLGKYVSFHDEVRVEDIAAAFQSAIDDQLSDVVSGGGRFACITHSTGGPVIRTWWDRYHQAQGASAKCPLSHLIMLAPANYGSALAQLGKARIGRLKSWMDGIEPGQGVLDWLELGSAGAWDLNQRWIARQAGQIGPSGVYPFVVTGQSIDRKFYDNLNTYTGEAGSDGVVRVAAANLRGRYVRLEQQEPVEQPGKPGKFDAAELRLAVSKDAPETALLVVPRRSHSGTAMGIMRSVRPEPQPNRPDETVMAILSCLKVSTDAEYGQLSREFDARTSQVQEEERLEVEKKLFLAPTYFFHDRYSMVIFRIRDTEGHAVADFDLTLTAGEDDNPNHLPKGFFVDRQRNSLQPETITYYFDYDVMSGAKAVPGSDGTPVRLALPGVERLGMKIDPRPAAGFVHYLPCRIHASKKLMQSVLSPNATTLIDIVLQRIVRKNVFRLTRLTKDYKAEDFKRVLPGDEIVP